MKRKKTLAALIIIGAGCSLRGNEPATSTPQPSVSTTLAPGVVHDPIQQRTGVVNPASSGGGGGGGGTVEYIYDRAQATAPSQTPAMPMIPTPQQATTPTTTTPQPPKALSVFNTPGLRQDGNRAILGYSSTATWVGPFRGGYVNGGEVDRDVRAKKLAVAFVGESVASWDASKDTGSYGFWDASLGIVAFGIPFGGPFRVTIAAIDPTSGLAVAYLLYKSLPAETWVLWYKEESAQDVTILVRGGNVIPANLR